MTVENLKVESASVRVSNANEEGREYNISASIRTKDGKVLNIDGGSVLKGAENVANIYSNNEFEKSLSITYIGSAHNDVSAQCAINQLVNEFISVATTKALAEAAE